MPTPDEVLASHIAAKLAGALLPTTWVEVLDEARWVIAAVAHIEDLDRAHQQLFNMPASVAVRATNLWVSTYREARQCDANT